MLGNLLVIFGQRSLNMRRTTFDPKLTNKWRYLPYWQIWGGKGIESESAKPQTFSPHPSIDHFLQCTHQPSYKGGPLGGWGLANAPWLSFLLSSMSSSLLPVSLPVLPVLPLLESGMNSTIPCHRRKYIHVTKICERFNVALPLSYMGEVDWPIIHLDISGSIIGEYSVHVSHLWHRYWVSTFNL